jgi:hypothetical protein
VNLQYWATSDVNDTKTYLDGHSHGLELERVSTSVTCNPKNVRPYQVDHRLLFDSPVQYWDRQLGFVGVGPLIGDLGPDLRAELISLKGFDEPSTH